MRIFPSTGVLAALLLVLAVTTSCASSSDPAKSASSTTGTSNAGMDSGDPLDASDDERDPLEGMNRAVFEFNDAADRFVIKPLAIAYRDGLPEPVQRSIHNTLFNLRSPVILANDVLQGEGERAEITLSRFLVNTTFGLLGLFDVASDWGLQQHDEDFGQTYAVWGMNEGPYLVLPILGPSNPRDTLGLVTEFFTDPFGIAASDNDLDYLNYTRFGVSGIDQRSRVIDQLDNIRSTSIDYYAAIRSLYRQRRDEEIRNGRPSMSQPAPGGAGLGATGAASGPSDNSAP